MEFNNVINIEEGIIQTIERRTGLGDGNISGDATRLKQFTGDVNNAYSRAAAIIMEADGRMQWDDPNHTNAPAADANLVSGQKKYEVFEAIPTALQDWLQVENVEILDSDDNGIKLTAKDLSEFDSAESEFKSTNGTPEFFDFSGAEVKLYPAPNYDKTDGLTIFFKRSPSYFAYDDTTKRPGFDTLSHELLPLWASYWWCSDKGLSNAKDIRSEISQLEKRLRLSYTKRDKIKKRKLNPLVGNNR